MVRRQAQPSLKAILKGQSTLMTVSESLHPVIRRAVEAADLSGLLRERIQGGLTTSGNGEEREAQVARIQERLDRLRRSAEHIAAEVAAMTKDLEQLDPPRSASDKPGS